jgi:hypothetical protein
LQGVIDREGLGIDLNLLLPGSGASPQDIESMINTLSGSITTDMEVEAFEDMMEELEMQLAPQGEEPEAPAAPGGGEPTGVLPPEGENDIAFTPDRPGTTRY